MGGAGGESCSIVTIKNQMQAGVLRRESIIIAGEDFGVASEAFRAAIERVKSGAQGAAAAGAAPFEPAGVTGKIGMRTRPGQRIVEFKLSFDGRPVRLEPSAQVARELTTTFEGAAVSPEPWTGWTVRLGPVAGPLQLVAELGVEFAPAAASGFQLLPVVFGFFDVPFALHYLMGVVVLQQDARKHFNTMVTVDRPPRGGSP
jgi:hypothetical protein